MSIEYNIKQNIISGEQFRISVLTDRLIRLEYSESGTFTDEETSAVICRNFPKIYYDVSTENDILMVETDSLLLKYDGGPFSSTGLSIELKENMQRWYYSVVYANSDENLLGTARTLDMTDGFASLEGGIFGGKGFAVLDDSRSAVLNDGEYFPRNDDGMDLYFFGYGKKYYDGLKDLYTLTGNVPMIPRYALGNWWSRYYRYSEESYLELMDRFEEEKIPLSVAVIDMDWHITDVDPKYGTGWTGYSWNKELFPDPQRFLKALKDKKLYTTLNLHPADGIRGFEDMYENMAYRMGIEPATGKAIEFDFGNKEFRDAYFEEVLHPYERDGVDFWWIDWQQGTGKAGVEVDPLFLLNHYHYKDMEDRKIRPMIFSRYAGVGSHRYPIGFSGDTHTTWRSLAYQPYFTSTASNIGYGWWSHDIGGHMLGDKDNERLVRWVQFGVFSPIMRIHSSSSAFFNKEPWNLEEPYKSIIIEFMRLRHKLLPYLYTMNYVAHKSGRPLIRPMYYICPDNKESYEVKNEYGFGDVLIVGTITSPADKDLKLGESVMYIPNGRWYDIFTGNVYDGDKKRKLYRTLDSIPVLLPEGGIVPLSADDYDNGCDNPKSFEVSIGYGKDGFFDMYEDDGISMEYAAGRSVTTLFEFYCDSEENRAVFRINSAEGSIGLIPEKRSYRVKLYGVRPCDEARVSLRQNGASGEINFEYDEKKNIISADIPEGEIVFDREVIFEGVTSTENDVEKLLFEVLDRAWIPMLLKEKIYGAYREAASNEDFLKWLSEADAPETLKDAIREFL